MLEVRPSHDDEIDFFELFETLWLGKWLISAFVAISVLLSGGFLFITTPIYESKINFSVDMKVWYHKDKSINNDFIRMFYSKIMFDAWKSENEKSELVYKDFSNTREVNGFTFAKEKNDLFVYFVEDKNSSLSALVVKSNKLSQLSEFFKYVNFINNKLTSNYLMLEKRALKVIQLTIDDDELDSNKRKVFELGSKFIINIENGSKVMKLDPPTLPKKISPNIKLTLALSIVLGGMIGAAIVLVNNIIRKRKESLSKV